MTLVVRRTSGADHSARTTGVEGDVVVDAVVAAAVERWLSIDLPSATAFAWAAGHTVALAGLSSPRRRRPLSSHDVHLRHRDQSLEMRGNRASEPARRVLARARATESRDPR